MKKTINYLFAATALIVAASCTKDLQPTELGTVREGRILTATFASDNLSTKTFTTDGKTPLWAVGDKIQFSDGTSTQEFTLVADTPGANEAQITDGGTGFKVTVPEGWGSTIYAVYPSSSYVGIDSEEIRFSIPVLQDGTFASANICTAKTTGTTLEFKNATSIVKLASVESGINYVVLPAANIAGTYQVNPGSAPTPVSGKTKGHVTITTTGAEYYAAVAPVSVASGTSVLFEDAACNIIGSKMTSSVNTFVLNKIHNLGAIAKNSTVPAGILNSVFSVSATGKVHFSKGNLYWNGSKFLIEDSQTAYPSVWDASHVGHFFWSKTESVAYAEIYSDDDRTGSDVAFFAESRGGVTVDGQSCRYGLTKDEWDYLLYTRNVNGGTGSGNSFKRATVCSVYGLILYADDYTAQSSDSSYDSDTWETMEKAGCVFLPASGIRNGHILLNDGQYSHLVEYWTSTIGSYDKSKDYIEPKDYAWYMYFQDFNPEFNQYVRYYGAPVRLVSAAL